MNMRIEANLAIKTLTVEGVQTEQANKIIDGFFSVLGVKTTSLLQINEVPKKEEKLGTSTLKGVEKSPLIIQNPPKALPKIDDKRTLHVPIAEFVNESHSSNVRELDNGTKIYQTEYWCMCGHEGKRFILKTNRYTKCHQCEMKLLIEPATLETDENGLPLPDKSGSFFIAREAFEIDAE